MIKYLVNGFEYKVYQVEVESETETSVTFTGAESKKITYDGLSFFDSVEEADYFLRARFNLQLDLFQSSLEQLQKQILASRALFENSIKNGLEVVRL